jgi:hypothetical protein
MSIENMNKIENWLKSQCPGTQVLSKTEDEIRFEIPDWREIVVKDLGDGTFSLDERRMDSKEFYQDLNSPCSLQEIGNTIYGHWSSAQMKQQLANTPHTPPVLKALLSFKEYLKQGKNTATDYCKAAIAGWLKNHPGHVISQFSRGDDIGLSDETPALLIKNWKRMDKNKREDLGENIYEYGFDCLPFDAQLRAYVIINAKTFEVYEVVVQGE